MREQLRQMHDELIGSVTTAAGLLKLVNTGCSQQGGDTWKTGLGLEPATSLGIARRAEETMLRSFTDAMNIGVGCCR